MRCPLIFLTAKAVIHKEETPGHELTRGCRTCGGLGFGLAGLKGRARNRDRKETLGRKERSEELLESLRFASRIKWRRIRAFTDGFGGGAEGTLWWQVNAAFCPIRKLEFPEAFR